MTIPWRSIWEEEPGVLSWARVHSTLTVFAAIAVLIYVVVSNHALPDATTLGGLGAFSTAPYAVNKISMAFSKT